MYLENFPGTAQKEHITSHCVIASNVQDLNHKLPFKPVKFIKNNNNEHHTADRVFESFKLWYKFPGLQVMITFIIDYFIIINCLVYEITNNCGKMAKQQKKKQKIHI